MNEIKKFRNQLEEANKFFNPLQEEIDLFKRGKKIPEVVFQLLLKHRQTITN